VPVAVRLSDPLTPATVSDQVALATVSAELAPGGKDVKATEL
jgi:hypothetical protein